jgi:hypothetical protein
VFLDGLCLVDEASGAVFGPEGLSLLSLASAGRGAALDGWRRACAARRRRWRLAPRAAAAAGALLLGAVALALCWAAPRVEPGWLVGDV